MEHEKVIGSTSKRRKRLLLFFPALGGAHTWPLSSVPLRVGVLTYQFAHGSTNIIILIALFYLFFFT